MHLFWQLQSAVVLLLTQSIFAANIIPKNERCVTAVYTALGYISFTGEPTTGAWNKRCRNPLMVTSIYAASEHYCDEHEQEAGLGQLNSYCQKFAHTDFLPRENVAANLTDEKVQKLRVVEFQELSYVDTINYPVLISPRYYGRTFTTIDTWQLEIWAHHAYGYLGYFYWGCVILVGTAYRLFQQSSAQVISPTLSTPSLILYRVLWQLYHRMQEYLIIAFPVKPPNRMVLWFDLPRRIDALVIAGFWLMSIILTCITYPLSADNIYWPSLIGQLLRYVADRTGIMSFANLPLLWVFAGRNNIFQWATGWSFSTFNIFHRHVAWVATIQAAIHTATYLVLFYRTSERKFWKQLNKSYIIWGAVATAAMVAILPLAINRLRKQSYEFFLIVHITFSLATVVGCFYHIIIFEGEGYEYYLWPVVIIWCLDRVLRLIRIFYGNLYFHLRRGKLQCTKSVAIFDKASNVVRLEVTPASSYYHPTSSSYYYLYQPFRFRGWENHPFTLGSWTYASTEDADYDNSTSQKPLDSVDGSQIPLLSSVDEAQGNIKQKPKFIFWIRPYDGWTRSLRDQCLASPSLTIQPRIFLEGPYGEPFSLDHYDSILLIAGGTGIACAVPYIKEQIHLLGEGAGAICNDIESPRRDIHLVWTARETSFITDVATRELTEAILYEGFSASLHSTSSSSSSLSSSSSSNDTIKIPLARHHHSANSNTTTTTTTTATTKCVDLEIRPHRPDLRGLVMEHAREANAANRSTVIVVSGPAKMADDVRAAVQLAMRRGYRRIVYREESFSW